MNSCHPRELLTPYQRELLEKVPSEDILGAYLLLGQIARRNLPLLTWLLGYRDLSRFHYEELKKLSQERLLTEKAARRLWLWSRGFFKTSLVTISHSIYLIINNPDIRILVVSYTLEIAKKIIGEIRDHFIRNDNFRNCFPEFCPQPNKEGKIEFGTTEQFTVPNRAKILKEPTIMCAGIGTNLTGLHYDFMKIDDLVIKDSVANEAQRQSSKDYYGYLRPLFDKAVYPKEDITGSIYHFNDLHCDLKKSPEFELSFIPARNAQGEYAFPERLDERGLEGLLSDPTIGPLVVNSQYLLNPINPKDTKFKEEWFKHYDEVPKEELAEYVLVDPASTQKKKSDYTVIERWGISWDGKFYLFEGIRDRLTVFQRIDKVVEMAKRCKRLMQVKYEVLGGRHGDLESLKQRFLEERLHIIPTETKATTSSKQDRIEQRLVGHFHAGVILMPRSYFYRSEYDGKIYDFIQQYKLEYLQFPFCEHDDILDCHSQLYEEMGELIRGRKPAEAKTEKKWGTADDWEQLYKEMDNYQFENPFLTRERAMDLLRLKRFRETLRKVTA